MTRAIKITDKNRGKILKETGCSESDLDNQLDHNHLDTIVYYCVVDLRDEDPEVFVWLPEATLVTFYEFVNRQSDADHDWAEVHKL